VEEPVQRASGEQLGPAARDALRIERACARAVETAAIVDERELRRPDRPADHVREERAALEHVLRVECAGEDSEEVGRGERVEHDGHLRGRRLGGSEHRDRAVDGLVGDRFPREGVQPAGDHVGEAGLGLLAFDGEGHDERPRVGPGVLDVDTGRRGDRDPRDRVADLRQVDLGHARVARNRVPLQVERQADLVVGAHVGAVLAEDLRHRGDGLGVGEPVVLVGFGERGVVPGSPDRLLRLVERGVGRPGVAEAAVADHADPESA
jgi:hypothetical protein